MPDDDDRSRRRRRKPDDDDGETAARSRRRQRPDDDDDSAEATQRKGLLDDERLDPLRRSKWFKALLPVFVVVLLSFCVIPLGIYPPLALLTATLGQLLILVAFIIGCIQATKAGYKVEFLGFLGEASIFSYLLVILVFGWCWYTVVYCLLWFICQLKMATIRPRLVVPWLLLQLYGFLMIVAAGVTAVIGNRLGFMPANQGVQQQNAMVAQGAPPFQNPPVAFQNPPNVLPPENFPLKKKAGDQPFPNVMPPDNFPLKKKAGDQPVPANVTGDAGLDSLLDDIASKDFFKSQKAADELTNIAPNEHRPLVAQYLAKLVNDPRDHVRNGAIKALAVWATTNEVPALIACLDSKNPFIRKDVLQTLGKLKDERAVVPVVRCFENFFTRGDAENALRTMGSMAEKEVVILLNKKDLALRQATVQLLKDIGTRQSIPALQALSNDFLLMQPAREALAAIMAREKK